MLFEILINPFKSIKTLNSILYQQKTLRKQLEELMLNLETLRTEIAENNSVVSSAVTLISTLVAELQAAAGNQAEIDAIVAQLDTQTDLLAAAVAANTVAAPAPVEEPVVVVEEPVVVVDEPVVEEPVAEPTVE